jgi:hypothetical protein
MVEKGIEPALFPKLIQYGWRRYRSLETWWNHEYDGSSFKSFKIEARLAEELKHYYASFVSKNTWMILFREQNMMIDWLTMMLIC